MRVSFNFVRSEQANHGKTDRFHEEDVLGSSEIRKSLSLNGVDSQTFLAEDIFPRRKSRVGVGKMVRMRGTNIDAVERLGGGVN